MAVADATRRNDPADQPIPYELTDYGKATAAAQGLAPVLQLFRDDAPTLVLDEAKEAYGPRTMWGPLPEPVPFDPADHDRIPPDDLLICEHCAGQGVTEAIVDGYVVDRPCAWCAGTGERTRP